MILNGDVLEMSGIMDVGYLRCHCT